MNSPPPPYTRRPFETQISTSEARKLRLHRFLIDAIAFAYDVDYSQLKTALSPTILCSSNDPKVPSKLAILSQDERDEILYLATLVRDAYEKVKIFQSHLTTEAESSLLYSQVIEPAQRLLIDPCYALNLLRLYADHKGINRYKAGHYWPKSIIPFSGWHLLPQKHLGKRIISDQLLSDRITPNEQTRLLLGAAVAKFSDTYWICRNGRQLSGCYYCAVPYRTLAALVEEKVVAAGLVSSTKAHAIRTHPIHQAVINRYNKQRNEQVATGRLSQV